MSSTSSLRVSCIVTYSTLSPFRMPWVTYWAASVVFPLPGGPLSVYSRRAGSPPSSRRSTPATPVDILIGGGEAAETYILRGWRAESRRPLRRFDVDEHVPAHPADDGQVLAGGELAVVDLVVLPAEDAPAGQRLDVADLHEVVGFDVRVDVPQRLGGLDGRGADDGVGEPVAGVEVGGVEVGPGPELLGHRRHDAVLGLLRRPCLRRPEHEPVALAHVRDPRAATLESVCGSIMRDR